LLYVRASEKVHSERWTGLERGKIMGRGVFCDMMLMTFGVKAP
jgi:hypothetical protein